MKISVLSICAGLAILSLAACGTDMAPTPEYKPPVSSPQPYAPVAKPVTPPPPVYKPVSNDLCGSETLQYLVGKMRTEIPVPLDPGKRRVVCSNCVITQDFRSERQTITFDSVTGLITSVKCG